MSVQRWCRPGAWRWSLGDAAVLLVLPLESQPATRLCVEYPDGGMKASERHGQSVSGQH